MRTLYRNARVYTPTAFDARAFVVDGDAIAWIGDDSAGEFIGAQQTVDLGGAFVTPAFVDAHVHATAAGLALTGLDLAGCASLAEALAKLERHARAGRGRPIIGSGWDDTTWPEGRAPSRHELDRASYGGSVYLARVDAHSAVVSSSLAAAVDGLAGLPGYDREGVLRTEAHHAARGAALAAMTTGQVADAQRALRAHAASHGIACLHEMAGPQISSADDVASLLRVAAEEPGPEVVAYWGELNGVEAARDLGAVGAGGDLFCDGSIGSHTAAWHEPYSDRPDTSGTLRFTTEQLADHLVACARAGLQAGFHAIGDAAIDQVLDAIDTASARLGRLAGAGHRLEHAEAVRDPARLAASGLIASVQPVFDALWGGERGLYTQRLGAARARGLNRFADLAAAGVPLALGSDTPVTPLGPWAAIRAAAYPHDPATALSPRAAFSAHTRGGWRAAGSAGGTLEPGQPATFSVWEAGELAVDTPDERRSRWSTDARAGVPGLPPLGPGAPLPTCLSTVVRGRPVYGPAILSG